MRLLSIKRILALRAAFISTELMRLGQVRKLPEDYMEMAKKKSLVCNVGFEK